MSKQKPQSTKQSPATGVTGRPRLRKLKVSSATPDSRIYSHGFVVGGKRLQGPKLAESKSQTKPAKDHEGKSEEIPLVELRRKKPKS